MRRRAEQMEATRQRIVDATVELHTTVGPARTTISAVAERAGVTRVTVYRHFPDIDALFEACSGRWSSRHPAPDPSAWSRIERWEDRVRTALHELYAWYGTHSDDLLPIYRDLAAVPEETRTAMQEEDDRYADALVRGSAVRGAARRRLRAAAGHVVGFWTWHSLAVEQGLGDGEAADLAAALLAAAARR